MTVAQAIQVGALTSFAAVAAPRPRRAAPAARAAAGRVCPGAAAMTEVVAVLTPLPLRLQCVRVL